jgi:formylglycine-generating enzyme required for sulfatase activity
MTNDSSTPQPTGTNPAGIPVYTFGGLEFVRVPKGKFIMGGEVGDREKPQREVDIPCDYWIGRFPVNNAQCNEFVQAMGARPPVYNEHPVLDWSKRRDHPVVFVTWEFAMSYCMWLNELHGSELPEGYQFRLPTEAEWEKAARGQNGNEWPWGNVFDPTRSNCDGASKTTTPIGKYSPRGDSPYGATDIAGNVWEWCHSLYEPYPYKANDGREDETASGDRFLRGGSFSSGRGHSRGPFRYDSGPGYLGYFIGFRVAASPISPVK